IISLPASPSLLPLPPCPSPSPHPIACMAVGAVPIGPIVWRDRYHRAHEANTSITSITSTGHTGIGAVSLLVMEGTEGRDLQPFQPPPPPPPPPPSPYTPPPPDAFDGPYRNASILCHILAPPIRWLRNGRPLPYGASTVGPIALGGLVVTHSLLGVTEDEWGSGDVFTCQVGQEMRNVSKVGCGGEYGLWGNPPPPAAITVRVTPPPFVAIFQDKVAKLTCRVLNVPSMEGLDVAWWKEDGTEVDTSRLPHSLEPNGLFSAGAVATVRTSEWERGDTFTCRVTHPELLFPSELRKEEAPSVFVLPPPPEQLSLRERATITCLVMGFNPPDLFILWLRNGNPIPEAQYVTVTPLPQPHNPQSHNPISYMTYSSLTVAIGDWANGDMFTCVVGHERIPMQVMQKSVDIGSGKATALNVSLILQDGAGGCY
uniref:Uncharacterized protein n=1 Tax=Melopsittacus undulatus TaxID=13146 RepID=A0A8V5GBI3_MELUD